jgi:hypothetical protein
MRPVRLILVRKPVSVENILEREKERDELKEFGELNFMVDNGESFLLE